MTKFITKFFLIISVCVCLSMAENNATIPKESNITQNESIKSRDDKKAEIIQNLKEIADINESSEMVQIIADKILDNNQSVFADNNKTKGLYELIMQIKDVNEQIKILTEQNLEFDNNVSIPEIENLKAHKNTLFAQIPNSITHQAIEQDSLIKFLKLKKELNEKMKKLQKNKKAKAYIEAALDYNCIELAELTFGALIKIENKFSNGANTGEFVSIIQEALFKIRTENYVKFQEIKGLASEAIQSELSQKFNDYAMLKQSYEEILSYLMKNVDTFSSSAIFTGLRLKDLINTINEKSPINIQTANTGKILIISFIILFAFSLRKFLANIVFFVIKLFFKDKESQKALKSDFVNIIKKPLGWLLVAFGVDLSMTIFYYPAPVPMKFSDILSILYVILYAWLVTEIISGVGVMIVGNIAKKGGRKEVLNLMLRIVHIVVIIIAILIILTHLGFDVSTIVASLGIGGLAVAFATKDIIANFFASIMLIFDNSFSQGDWIVIGDIQGTIVETGLRKTTIRTFDNSLVSIPNSKILDNNIKNWNRRKMGRNIELTIGVQYSTTINELKSCIAEIKEMLRNHEGIAQPNQNLDLSGALRYKQNMVSVDDLAGYKSYLWVALKNFSDSSIDIWVYCFTKTTQWGPYLEVKEDIMLKIMEILERNHINFAFPSQSLYLEKMPREIFGKGDKDA